MERYPYSGIQEIQAKGRRCNFPTQKKGLSTSTVVMRCVIVIKYIYIYIFFFFFFVTTRGGVPNARLPPRCIAQHHNRPTYPTSLYNTHDVFHSHDQKPCFPSHTHTHTLAPDSRPGSGSGCVYVCVCVCGGGGGGHSTARPHPLTDPETSTYIYI